MLPVATQSNLEAWLGADSAARGTANLLYPQFRELYRGVQVPCVENAPCNSIQSLPSASFGKSRVLDPKKIFAARATIFDL